MRIVHIAPNSPYNDYWGYQDNLLPKYQRKLGHEVTVITTNLMHLDGRIVETDCTDYSLKDGVRVIRRAYKQYFHPTLTGVLTNLDVSSLLENLHPDFIFYHGLVSYTIHDVVKYVKKHPNCRFVEDNHMDYNIGDGSTTLKQKVIRAWRRILNKRPSLYASKIYGVTPWRKSYAEDYFRIPREKTGVLIMGADDEKIDFMHKDEIRANIRSKYSVSEADFLIITGGKIDRKKNITVLMDACRRLEKVKLLIFGNVAEDLK